jgi:hypothetical protein
VSIPRFAISAATVFAIAALAAHLHATPGYGSRASFTLLSGLAFGVLLQRSRFCFFCMLRDFFERRQSDGLIGILAALELVCWGRSPICEPIRLGLRRNSAGGPGLPLSS